MPAVDCNVLWSMFLVFLVIFLNSQFSNNGIKTSKYKIKNTCVEPGREIRGQKQEVGRQKPCEHTGVTQGDPGERVNMYMSS